MCAASAIAHMSCIRGRWASLQGGETAHYLAQGAHVLSNMLHCCCTLAHTLKQSLPTTLWQTPHCCCCATAARAATTTSFCSSGVRTTCNRPSQAARGRFQPTLTTLLSHTLGDGCPLPADLGQGGKENPKSCLSAAALAACSSSLSLSPPRAAVLSSAAPTTALVATQLPAYKRHGACSNRACCPQQVHCIVRCSLLLAVHTPAA
jgi:hypothetical protein